MPPADETAAREHEAALLSRALESGRVHSAYLLSGAGDAPRTAALRFARGVVCLGEGERPCEVCLACRRSRSSDERPAVSLDGAGKKGPLLRHVGDHPDLLWIERGASDTRVRIAQVRALQAALRLRTHEGGRRAAVIADAERLNAEAQNALLRVLEEPPPDTVIVLVAASSAGLLATLRSRCQRVRFAPNQGDPWLSPDADEDVRALVRRIDAIAAATLPELLDWAEEYRGARAEAAPAVEALLETGSAWLRARVAAGARQAPAARDMTPALDAFSTLRAARRALVSRNANPQMVAERALFALREAAVR